MSCRPTTEQVGVPRACYSDVRQVDVLLRSVAILVYTPSMLLAPPVGLAHTKHVCQQQGSSRSGLPVVRSGRNGSNQSTQRGFLVCVELLRSSLYFQACQMN